jgi:hypothetical protein
MNLPLLIVAAPLLALPQTGNPNNGDPGNPPITNCGSSWIWKVSDGDGSGRYCGPEVDDPFEDIYEVAERALAEVVEGAISCDECDSTASEQFCQPFATVTSSILVLTFPQPGCVGIEVLDAQGTAGCTACPPL